MENELAKLFRFATSQTYFYFDGKIFDQVDGVAIGSPLGLALANLFMVYNEKQWLESDHGRLVKFNCRYVDDIVYLFENKHHALTFLHFLNIQHPNLNLTIKNEYTKQLPFLDVLILVQTDQLPVAIVKVHLQAFYKSTIVLYHLHTRKITLKTKLFA